MAYDEALARRIRAALRDKPMRGYVFVDPKTLASAADLRRWIKICTGFVAKLPAKPAKKTAKNKPKEKQ